MRKPCESCEAIIVGSREGVFGGKAVVNRNDQGASVGGETAKEGMVHGNGGAEVEEATAMEVEEKGKLLMGGGTRREIEASPGREGGVKGDIFGSHILEWASRGGASRQ